MLLSLPPLLLLALGTVGFFGNAVTGFAEDAADRLLGLAGMVLTDDDVDLLRPVVEGVLTEGRDDLASLGVILTLCSASRAPGGHRHPAAGPRTRLRTGGSAHTS